MSSQLIRFLKRAPAGNTRKVRKSTNMTWIPRSIWVMTIPTAAYRWKSDITTAMAVMKVATLPVSRRDGPSSSSMNFSALRRASSETTTSCSAPRSVSSIVSSRSRSRPAAAGGL